MKIMVANCSASGNRSMAENQPARINGVEILSLRNLGNMEIVILHPACGIAYCGKENCGNRDLRSCISHPASCKLRKGELWKEICGE